MIVTLKKTGSTFFMKYSDIRFPNLGVVLPHVGRSITIGRFQIMYYGIIIAAGFFLGLLVARMEAKRTGQNPELYVDYLLWMMIPAILGARAYYVLFSWDYYSRYPAEIINIRHGGLGIAGGILAGVLVLAVFCKKRNVSMALMLDTLTPGLLVGQILGRWGNFFNREAFGRYTEKLFAMQIPLDYFKENGRLSELEGTGILDHLKTLTVGGQNLSYIQVHPTFLYEGMWNLALLLLILLFFRYRKKFDGEIFCIYLMGYGFGRFFIEGLRVDQLQIGNTHIAATQVLCVLAFFASLLVLVRGRRKGKLAN